MSVTVISATPIILFSAIDALVPIIAGVTASVAAAGSMAGNLVKTIHDINKNGNPEYIQLEHQEMQEILKKEFTTTIKDKDTLIKTLEEHGAVDIEDRDNTVMCRCEAFYLTFTKNDAESPYVMTAIFNDEYGLEDLAKDLGEEYAINAQEASYNKIKERLEERNMTISEEEVYEDNTIVLTIDLD